MDKVQGGTPREANSLCETCRYAVHVRGFNMREFIQCTYAGKVVHFRVFQCSQYNASNTPDLDDMKKIAWVVETRNRGKWGFNSDDKNEVVVRPPNPTENYPGQFGPTTTGI